LYQSIALDSIERIYAVATIPEGSIAPETIQKQNYDNERTETENRRQLFTTRFNCAAKYTIVTATTSFVIPSHPNNQN
jgi:hypothetical protein